MGYRRSRLHRLHVSHPVLRAFVPFLVHIIPMSQTKHEIQALLSAAGDQPRHRFGQNFMIDQNLVRLVADAGN